MPSFTDQNVGSDFEDAGIRPILGTGLNISSFEKIIHENGSGNSAIAAGEGNIPKQHRVVMNKKAMPRRSFHNPTQTPGAVSQILGQDGKEQDVKNSEEDPQDSLFHQVYQWLQREKAKQKTSRVKSSGARDGVGSGDDDYYDGVPLERTISRGSDSAHALDKLEKILIQHAASHREDVKYGYLRGRQSSRKRHVKGLRRGSASESEYTDLDAPAPSVDAVLDNSKALAYTGGTAHDDERGTDDRRNKDKEAWFIFKSEIVRLVHTLQLKGWRKFPPELAGDIEVVRLSGALTNAVYLVTPPKNIPALKAADGSDTVVPRKFPPKLLLRIYGPQVDHLIDREKELSILRRLGRKNIGPRVLGTFINGRFEEYFEARPLTPAELRYPETMKQIAKRMRELHEGIDLLVEERDGGPNVFKNWDKWVDRCEQVINWLDKEIQSKNNEVKAASEPWRRRGFVCGVPWPVFRKAVDNYRKWLVSSCGGVQEVERQLVFAHNDTQYGNLLRMEPATKSPLLLPENKHKQLVVIDFEYASANTPAFEFANHFSEWCYNYHDPERSWACNIKGYPTPEQQRLFISAYLAHRPGMLSSSTTPIMPANSSNAISFTPLDLDAGPDVDLLAQSAVEKAQEDTVENDIQFYMRQTRIWRVFNSAQWVAWGIVQAKVPGMEEGIVADAAKMSNGSNGTSNCSSENEEANSNTPLVDADKAEAEDEFDYLAYSQDRAMFFWADLLALNLIREDELPAEMAAYIKSRIIEY